MTDRKPIPEPLKRAHLYLVALDSEAENKKAREDHRGYLKSFIKDSCEPDESGNYTYEFSDPIFGCRGLMLQRRTTEWVDEAKVIAHLAMTTDEIYNRCVKQVTVTRLDMDEVYALNQEGLISDEVIDSFIEIDESYALVKVKA